ncbi:MAG: dienelactone hydrolase family protein [Bacteroidia bacterium]
MKKLPLLLFVLIVTNSYSQKSCCSLMASAEAFADFTKDKDFILSHIVPEPFMLTNEAGKDISYKTPEGKTAYAYEIKSLKPTNNYIFVFHEWWGLNDYVKQESEKLFNAIANVNVIAIDLYNKKVATDRDSAAKYMQAVNIKEAEDVIKGAIAYAGKKANIATIGWCFGGGWSLQTALMCEKQAKACVMYYGMPEENKDKLKSLHAPVLFVWAEQDKWINKDIVTSFENKMKELKKSLEVKPYNAVHGFANPSNPKYAKSYSEEAFEHTTAFIKNNFK